MQSQCRMYCEASFVCVASRHRVIKPIQKNFLSDTVSPSLIHHLYSRRFCPLAMPGMCKTGTRRELQTRRPAPLASSTPAHARHPSDTHIYTWAGADGWPNYATLRPQHRQDTHPNRYDVHSQPALQAAAQNGTNQEGRCRNSCCLPCSSKAPGIESK